MASAFMESSTAPAVRKTKKTAGWPPDVDRNPFLSKREVRSINIEGHVNSMAGCCFTYADMVSVVSTCACQARGVGSNPTICSILF